MASDDRMEESDSDWSDCPELEEEPDEATDALFAQYKGTPLDCLQADQSLLGWNLKSTGAKEQFEILDYIKAVNFIRSKSKTEMSETEFLGLRKTWQSEEYLKPANPMDPFLCFDWDDMEAPELVETNQMVQNKSKLDELKKELGSISIPTGIMKDESYFDGYSDYSIHAEMLQDKIRTEAYKDTIYNNSSILKGKKIVDIGAGTGILSMFAADAGADHVYSCEMAEIAYDCIDIVRENNLQDKITVLKGKAEEQYEKIKDCDVIISEWMGYCLLFEGMLDSVIKVRDKILKPDGLMIPATANIEVCLMNNRDHWDYYNGFWGDVYGFKMNSMKKKTKYEAQVTAMDSRHVGSKLQELIKWNLKTCSIADLTFSSKIDLRSDIDGEIHGILASFDCGMIDCEKDDQGEKPIVLSTSPLKAPTHWKQTAFLIEHPVIVSTGDHITGLFELRRNHKNERELKVYIKLCHKNETICDQEYTVA